MSVVGLPGTGVGTPGPPGPTGPNPFLLTGFTGGTNDRLVYVLPDGVTCKDLHPSFTDQLGYSNILYKDAAGAYWLPGATITGTGLTPGFVRAMQPQTGAAIPNWRDIDPKLAQPADLAPTVNQSYVEFGRVLSATQWRFREPQVDGLTPTPAARFDGLLVANYPRNTTVPTGRFRIDRFGTFPNSNVYTGTVSTTLPYGAGIVFSSDGNGGNKFATDEVTGSVADAQLVYLLSTGGPTSKYGLFLRATGAAGSETALLAVADEAVGQTLKLVKRVAGVNTTLLDASGNPVSVPFTFVHGSSYYWRTEVFSTWVAVKVWATGATEPTDWTLSTFQSAVTGAGYTGVYSDYPAVNVALLSVVVNRGATAALTGVT